MKENLPLLSGQEIVNALQRIGYFVRKQKGSHIRLYHSSHLPVTVPAHREVDRGILRSILRTANLTVEEFKKFL